METAEAPSTSPTLLKALADWQNPEAWAAFTQGYVPYIDACANGGGLQPADVEEIRSRVLVSLISAIRSIPYDPARRFRGYIRVCVRNAIVDYLNESRKRPGSVGIGTGLSTEFEELADGLDEQTRDDLELLWRVFDVVKNRVTPTTWLAFELTRLQQMPVKDASEQLNITVSTLYVYRGRVLELLESVAAEFGVQETEEQG